MNRTRTMRLAAAATLLAAAGRAGAQVETAQFLETNEHGSFLRSTYRLPGVQPWVGDHEGRIALTTPRWVQDDGGLRWIPNEVSLGDDGAILFAGLGTNNQSLRLYGTGASQSVFDHTQTGSAGPFVAVADHAGVAAGMVVVDLDPGQEFAYEATVHVFSTTSSGTPAWSYAFPTTLNYFGGGVAISDDGSRILMWKADPHISKLRVETFDRQGNSISSGQLGYDANFHARQTRLSDDGRRAYFNILARSYIYDTTTGQMEYEHNIGASFDAHAFSGDGNRFAFGNFGYVRVFGETSPGVWSQLANYTTPSGTFVSRCALNRVGSRLGYLIQRYSPGYDQVSVGMYDVDAQSRLFEHLYDAAGTSNQLAASSCAIDDEGEYVSGSTWGDSFNATPEGFVFDAAGNATCEIDSRGSAMTSDMDAAGDVLAMGCKAVHANTFGNGGDVIVADAFPQELHVLGYARAGGTVELRVAQTGQRVQIAVCRELGNSNTPFGPSELNLNALLTTIGPITIPNGGLIRLIQIPGSLAGRIIHVQAGISGGNPHLTNKVSVRIQP